MLLRASTKSRDEVLAVYTDEFLSRICTKIDFENKQEERPFAEFLIKVSAFYLDIKRGNSDLLDWTEQKKLLDKFKARIERVKDCLEEIKEDTPLEFKFSKALKARAATDSTLKEFIIDGYTYSPLVNLLNTISAVAEDAKTVDIGKEHTDKDSHARAEWAREIKSHWPEKARVKWGFKEWNKADNKEKGEYTSECRDILFELMTALGEKVTEQNINTAMTSKENILD